MYEHSKQATDHSNNLINLRGSIGRNGSGERCFPACVGTQKNECGELVRSSGLRTEFSALGNPNEIEYQTMQSVYFLFFTRTFAIFSALSSLDGISREFGSCKFFSGEVGD